VKTYGYMALAVLLAFLLSLNTIKVFNLDEISLFITVVGLIAAFTINNAWERFSKIRDAVAQEMNGLATMYIYAKQMGDKRSIEKLQQAVIVYCDDVPQIEWKHYWKSERSHQKFRTIIEIVSQIKLKGQKDVELFDEVSEELRAASTARNSQLILAQTRVSVAQWILNLFLSGILIAGLTLLAIPNYALSIFIVTSMVTAVVMILLVIYELDSMGLAEEEVSMEPYAQVIRNVSEGKLIPDIQCWRQDKSALPAA
jgi:hypothetical protein